MKLSDRANQRLWDSLITEALIEDCNNELAEFENNAKPHTFSQSFEKKLNSLKHAIGRKESARGFVLFLRNAAVTVAAIMGVFFGCLLTQPEVYAAVEKVIRNVFIDHDNYLYQGELPEEPFDEYKRLGYVPEGYELRSIVYGGSAASLTYENEDEETIDFMYGIAALSSISIDNERHNYREVEHNGQIYYLYIAMEDNDWSSIIWYSGGYVYSIDAYFSESELVEIAESVEK